RPAPAPSPFPYTTLFRSSPRPSTLSTMPSQSSSMPLHTSAEGVPGTASQTNPPVAMSQTSVPALSHAPTPTLQASPRPVTLSISPSQSSSMPLQVSGWGSTGSAAQTRDVPSLLQVQVPVVPHASRPGVQAP